MALDITSYALGKKAGGGDTPTGTINITENGITNVSSYATADVNVQPDLESKSITITENKTTLIEPTQGKDGLSSVSVITNVSGGASYAPAYGISFNTNFSTNGTDTTTTSLDFTGLDTSNMTSMRKMFCNMRGLTSLDLSDFDTGKVTDMSYIFYYCSALPSITLGNKWDTSKVTTMSNMFARCNNLTTLDLSNFDTSSVTDMASMFSYTGSNGTLSITYGNGWDTSKVTNMNNLFTGNKNTSLDLSNYDTSSVTSMQNMFSNCSELTTLDLGSFNFTKNLTNVANMFSGCTNLIKIKFGTLHTQCNPTKTNEYQNCSNLTEIEIDEYIDDPDETGVSEVGGVSAFFDAVKSQIETLTVHKATSNGNSIGFGLMPNLTTLNLGDIDLTAFNAGSITQLVYNEMFENDSSLTSIDVRTIKTSGVKTFNNFFRNCSSLTNITFGGYFDTSDCISMMSMFGNCSNLTTLDLSTFNTKKVMDMGSIFNGCSNLETITFGNNFTFESISSGYFNTSIKNIFAGCTKLDNNTLNSILYLCTTIGNYYAGNKTLAELGIDSTFDNYANIPNLSNYQAFLDAGWTIS